MAKRIVQLDGIRAIAIAAVFLRPVFFIRLLWMGVDLFFILSGFLITGILIEHKDQTLRGYFGQFYGRRARRILPPYLLLLCIGLLFYGVWWLRHWYLYAFLMNLIAPLGILQARTVRPVVVTRGRGAVLFRLAVRSVFFERRWAGKISAYLHGGRAPSALDVYALVLNGMADLHAYAISHGYSRGGRFNGNRMAQIPG